MVYDPPKGHYTLTDAQCICGIKISWRGEVVGKIKSLKWLFWGTVRKNAEILPYLD